MAQKSNLFQFQFVQCIQIRLIQYAKNREELSIGFSYLIPLFEIVLLFTKFNLFFINILLFSSNDNNDNSDNS